MGPCCGRVMCASFLRCGEDWIMVWFVGFNTFVVVFWELLQAQQIQPELFLRPLSPQYFPDSFTAAFVPFWFLIEPSRRQQGHNRLIHLFNTPFTFH